jgi:hypothetical protein
MMDVFVIVFENGFSCNMNISDPFLCTSSLLLWVLSPDSFRMWLIDADFD